MPLPTSVMAGLTTGLKDVLVADFTAFATIDGELAGFVYSAPDLNQVFHPMRGRSVEDHLAEFQQRLAERGYRSASYTVVLDDNWRSRRTAEKLGARVTRNFNVYRTDFRPRDGNR
jgi:hypothetical protein